MSRGEEKQSNNEGHDEDEDEVFQQETKVGNVIERSPLMEAGKREAHSNVRFGSDEDDDEERDGFGNKFASNFDADAAHADTPVLEPCPHCGRKFRAEYLQRHIASRVCRKTRKVFQPSKKRMEQKVATDLACNRCL